MRMGYGIWVVMLGILGIIIGGAMYDDNYHKTIGTGGIILGVILIIVGAWWYMTKDKSAPKATIIPQAAQPAQPAKTP